MVVPEGRWLIVICEEFRPTATYADRGARSLASRYDGRGSRTQAVP